MLNYNSNIKHVNSSDTDPMLYWKRILEVLLFFKSLCSLLNFVTLGFASAFAFFCLVITIFYEFDVTNVSSHSCI